MFWVATSQSTDVLGFGSQRVRALMFWVATGQSTDVLGRNGEILLDPGGEGSVEVLGATTFLLFWLITLSCTFRLARAVGFV
jgi:hypothetical protein